MKQRTPEQRHREYMNRRAKALAAARAYTVAHPEANREASRRYRARHPERRRDTILRYRYKLSAAEFDAMKERQAGNCLCCGQLVKRLYVDHDHGCCDKTPTCGKCTRGLVCNGCNTNDRLSEPWVDKRGCRRGRLEVV